MLRPVAMDCSRSLQGEADRRGKGERAETEPMVAEACVDLRLYIGSSRRRRQQPREEEEGSEAIEQANGGPDPEGLGRICESSHQKEGACQFLFPPSRSPSRSPLFRFRL
ncbi:hypothetical protein BHE74_00055393 [Ensete ventricosum]|nr:hypothetical protein BHE74_00055393 [Ensete ventricosum]